MEKDSSDHDQPATVSRDRSTRHIIWGEARIPASIRNWRVWESAVRYQFWYSMLGLLLGLACILSGVVLFLHGVVGTTKSWTASVLGLKNSVSDVPAGVVVFIVGMIIVFITRFVVKTEK